MEGPKERDQLSVAGAWARLGLTFAALTYAAGSCSNCAFSYFVDP